MTDIEKKAKEIGEMKHTPEPWYADGCAIYHIPLTGQRAYFREFDCDLNGSVEDHANADRVVVCVNALAGIPNPQEWVEKMKAENARLRYALGKITKLNPLKGSDIGNALNIAYEALKGGDNGGA